MNIKSLSYLIELERSGSIYGAAKRALISPQGLSKAISSLEAELGVKLVDRAPHGTKLTEQGYLVLESAKAIVAEAERLEGELLQIGQAKPSENERIEVFVSHYAAEIASLDSDYVRILSTNTSYIEEPFNKMLLRAAQSDGTDLIFADVHSHTMRAIAERGDVMFEPIIQTRYGFIWKDGSDLQGRTLLHRADMCDLPIVLETDREAMHLTEQLFKDTPLRNVVMGTSSQLMLFQYTRMADSNVVALCDSFRYYIMKTHRPSEVEGLRFTPLSTLSSFVQIGFLLPSKVQLSMQAQRTIRILRHYLAEHCSDYF